MYMYERSEQGMDIWHRDESKYNTKKFNADVDLLDQEFTDLDTININDDNPNVDEHEND